MQNRAFISPREEKSADQRAPGRRPIIVGLPPCPKTVWSISHGADCVADIKVLSPETRIQNRSDARSSPVGGHRRRRLRGRRRGPAGLLQALLRHEEQLHGVHSVCAVQRPPDALQTACVQVPRRHAGGGAKPSYAWRRRGPPSSNTGLTTPKRARPSVRGSRLPRRSIAES